MENGICIFAKIIDYNVSGIPTIQCIHTLVAKFIILKDYVSSKKIIKKRCTKPSNNDNAKEMSKNRTRNR
jgi:hypothetical protein